MRSFKILLLTSLVGLIFGMGNHLDKGMKHVTTLTNKCSLNGLLETTRAIQVPFIQNFGQLNENIAFYVKTFWGNVLVYDNGDIHYIMPEKEKSPIRKGWVISEKFVGSLSSEMTGEKLSDSHISFFKGKSAQKWQKNVPTFNRVSCGEIYPGIQLKLNATGQNVEKLFYVSPHANPEVIKIKVEGADRLITSDTGQLELTTPSGIVTFSKPIAYQELSGSRTYVPIAYQVNGNEYNFKLSKYDLTRILVIDPLLSSTFLGGSGLGDESASCMTIDQNGNVFVAGWTSSSNFPTTTGAFDPSYNDQGDAFIAKFDANLEHMLACTFVGGQSGWDGEDVAYDLCVDKNGNVYMVGETGSSDFPTTYGAFDPTFNGTTGDAFVVKLDNNLQHLLAATYLGGSAGFTGRDAATAITIDSNGNVYVTGETEASDFPTTLGVFQTQFNGGYYDAFVVKFDANLKNLLAATFFGGNENDNGAGIAVDQYGNVCFVGATYSANLPTTTNAFDRTFNGVTNTDCDAFIGKLDGRLRNLVASTYLGELWSDRARDVAIDVNGDVYVAGWTCSSRFPTTPNAYDPTYNESIPSQYGVKGDVFVSRLSGNLQTLRSSTFIGGLDKDIPECLFLDTNANVFIAGYTNSADYPTTPGAFDTEYTGRGGFVSRLDGTLQNLFASTYLAGDEGKDGANAVSVNARGEVYVAGFTYSPDFPTTPNSFDPSYNWYCDAFVSKLDGSLSLAGGDERTQILKYDNGTVRWRMYLVNSIQDCGYFVKFTPPAGAILKSTRVRLEKLYSGSSDIQIQVLDHNKNKIGQSDVSFNRLHLGDWNEIPLPNIKLTNAFYVGVGLISPAVADTIWINGDEGPGLPGKSFHRKSGTWYDVNSSPYNWNLNIMIRAIIEIGTEVISVESDQIPADFYLEQNYPNPFNHQTRIQFQIPSTTDVCLKIYNNIGQQIRTLFDGQKPAGVYQEIWDGRDEQGQIVSSGVYFYRLVTPAITKIRQMTFVK